jgi:hypothetical protein
MGGVIKPFATCLFVLFTAAAAADDDRALRETLKSCLQETAEHYAGRCRGVACEPEELSRTIVLAQRTYCGFSAAPGQTPQPIPPEPLLRCLRQTAIQAATACEKGGCFPSSIFFIVGGAQRSRCGYTAYEPMEMPATSPPSATVASCVTSRNAKGEWVTACAP